MKNLLFTLLCGCSLSLGAQQALSLDECIRTAWERNPTYRNAALRVKEAQADYVAAVGAFLPRISATAEAGRRFGRSIDPITNAYTSATFDEGAVGLDVTLSLFEGFGRINRIRFEQLNRRRSQWQQQQQQNELAYRVMEVYYRLLLDEKMLQLAHEQNRLGERYLRQTEAFEQLGLKSASDLQEVKARREGDLYRYQSRLNSLRLTELELKQLMNYPPGDSLMVEHIADYEQLPPLPVLQAEELYAQSLAVMPSVHIMALQLKAARKQYARAGGAFSPTIYARFSMASNYLDGFSARQLSDNLGRYLGVGISFPLLSGLERLTTLRKQKLNLHRLRNEDEAQRQQLYTEVEQVALTLAAGQTEHRQALLQQQAEARVLKESERKWEEGLLSVFQLMEACNRFISAKAELVRTRLQVEMMRRLEDYYKTGSFADNSPKQ